MTTNKLNAMNKWLIALVFVLVPGFASAAPFNTNLYYGVQNSAEVTALQEFLTVQGDYTGPITGNFYSLTLQGVKNFQLRNGIQPVSGYFGILSRGVANTLLEPVAPEEETGTTTIKINPIHMEKDKVEKEEKAPERPKVVQRNRQTVAQENANAAPAAEAEPFVPKLKVKHGGLSAKVNEGQIRFEVEAFNQDGSKAEVQVMTDYPEIPSNFTINKVGKPGWFCLAPAYEGFPDRGCMNENPTVTGEYHVTFTLGNSTESFTVRITE